MILCFAVTEMGTNLSSGIHAGSSEEPHRCHTFPFPPLRSYPSLTSWRALLFFTSLGIEPVLAGVCASFFHLLWQPPTQRQHCRNPCPTSLSEWAAAGGTGGGKHMLPLELIQHLKRRRAVQRRPGDMAAGGEGTCGTCGSGPTNLSLEVCAHL